MCAHDIKINKVKINLTLIMQKVNKQINSKAETYIYGKGLKKRHNM